MTALNMRRLRQYATRDPLVRFGAIGNNQRSSEHNCAFSV